VEGSTLTDTELGDEGRRSGGEGVLVVEELANHHHGVGGGWWSALTTTSGAGGGCLISAHTPREEVKPEALERWSCGDHRLGLNSGGGGRRMEIRRRRQRRREVRDVGLAARRRACVRRVRTPEPKHFRIFLEVGTQDLPSKIGTLEDVLASCM
jgi:hypothetical protein